MKKIFELLANNKAVQTLACGKGQVVTTHISDEAYLIASAFLVSKKNILVIKPNQYEAQQLFHQFNLMNQEDVLFFPVDAVSYTHLTLPTTPVACRSRWSPYH